MIRKKVFVTIIKNYSEVVMQCHVFLSINGKISLLLTSEYEVFNMEKWKDLTEFRAWMMPWVSTRGVKSSKDNCIQFTKDSRGHRGVSVNFLNVFLMSMSFLIYMLWMNVHVFVIE